MAIPERQNQDTYHQGFDVIRLIASEFGNSPDVVRRQLMHASAQIEINGQVYTGDRLFIPVEQAAGKEVVVIGPERHWKMKFPTEPE